MKTAWTLSLIGLAAGLAMVVGCEQRAQRIDSTQRITTVDQIDVQDWEEAADAMLNSLITRGPLRDGRDSPAVIQVTRIINDTTQRINTAHLTDYILTELNRSGSAQALMWDEDPRLREQRDYEEHIGAREVPVREFDYTIGGRIIEERRSAGRVQQSTFVFTIWLNDPSTGTAIWQEREVIDKQGTRPAVGL